MPKDRIAEWILSLVVPPDRAASTVGDLMEDAGKGGWLWFWMCVARTALAFLLRNLAAAPLRLTGFAVLGWFAYMTASVILWLCGFVLATLLWGMAYFFTHHTGLELVANLLRIRFDWPPPPTGVMHWMEALMVWMMAPFQVGRFAARCWPGREVAAWIVMLMVWPLMAVFVPFVGLSTRVSLPVLPAVQAFVLLGLLWERRQSALAISLKPRS
jgi:hypothetical protein